MTENFGQLSSPPAPNDVNDRLSMRHMMDGLPNRLYHGVIFGLNLPSNGRAAAPGSVSSAFLGDPVPTDFGPTRNDHAHELAHNLGRLHAPFCGAEVPAEHVDPEWPFPAATLGPMDLGPNRLIFGFDTHARSASLFNPNQVVDPNRTFELMSYCRGGLGYQWISQHNYDRLRNAINTRFSPPPPPPSALQNFLVVRGTSDFSNNTAEFLPFGHLESRVEPPMPATGEFTLELRDRAGTLMQELAFQPTELIRTAPDGGTGVDEPRIGIFFIAVPANAAITQAAILHQGSVLTSRSATPNPPTV